MADGSLPFATPIEGLENDRFLRRYAWQRNYPAKSPAILRKAGA